MLSIIIPAYNEEKLIMKTSSTISEILYSENIEHEIIFVNDGSKDKTWEEIKKVSEQKKYIKGISFSRNFGKEAAIFSGLAYSSGDCCVVMDCDLQHPPQKIIEMYHLWESGYQIIEGVKKSRGNESKLHGLAAKVFYKLMSSATGIDMSRASDFKLLDRVVVDILLKMPERNTFFRALSSWVGFKGTSIEFEVAEREEGISKWSVKSLIKYALNNITSFSSAPLHMVTVLGIVFLLFSIILGIQTLYLYFIGRSLEGFTTVIVLLLFTGSILMISLGIIGYYLSKIYEEIKGRPKYIVAESTNVNESKGIL